jgi:hypothetical protein
MKQSTSGLHDTTHPGDSREQREAEDVMIRALARQLGVSLTPTAFKTPGGETVHVDGAAQKPFILCEAWAHQGRSKSAQRSKVLADALKLLFVERIVGQPADKILLLACDEAAARFRSGWAAEALAAVGIRLEVVCLPEQRRQQIRLAQQRQFR